MGEYDETAGPVTAGKTETLWRTGTLLVQVTAEHDRRHLGGRVVVVIVTVSSRGEEGRVPEKGRVWTEEERG